MMTGGWICKDRLAQVQRRNAELFNKKELF